MYRRSIAVLSFAAAAMPAVLVAQTANSTTVPATSLLDQSPAVRVQLSLGRLHVTNLRLGANRNVCTERSNGDRVERLSITAATALPTVHYEMTDGRNRLICDISHEQATVVHRAGDPEAKLLVLLRQQVQGLVVANIAVAETGASREYSSDSIWHLLLNLPTSDRDRIVDALTIIAPSWRLADLLNDIEADFEPRIERQPIPDKIAIEKLVERLSHRAYRERQAADRELRELGPAGIPYFRALESANLDREQRARIRVMREALSQPSSDSVERVVSWLSTDHRFWLDLLDSNNAARRELANRQLVRLGRLATPLTIDADPAVRQAQIGTLKRRWGNE